MEEKTVFGEAYKKKLLQEIKKEFPKDVSVGIQKIVKPGYSYEGIYVRIPGEYVSPTISLDSMTGHLKEDVENFKRIYNDAKNSAIKIDPNEISKWDWAKSRVQMKLLNPERNAEYLKDKVTIPFADLVEVFCIVFSATEEGLKSAAITCDMMAAWGVTPEDLFEAASQNMEPTMTRIIDIMIEAAKRKAREAGQEIDPITLEEMKFQWDIGPKQYVITNEKAKGVNGAACFPLMMGYLKKKFGTYYMLPSSIGEVIIIPESEGLDPESLTPNVMAVNREVLDPKEFLADHAYYFDGNELKPI